MDRHRRLNLVISACIGILPALAGLSRAAEPPLVARIDALVKKAGITAKGPGVAVLVIQNDKVLIKKGYGLANLKQRTAITPETTFELASLSKPFCAMAVLLLYDRGQLALDDDVRKFVPELAEYHRQHPIRILHLLQHTSGLPDYTDLDEPEPGPQGYFNNEVYAATLATRKDEFRPKVRPGRKYEYSNTNYMLLALIVERITKKSFGTFLHAEVLTPLGMKNTWVYESPAAVLKHPVSGWVNALGYEPRDEEDETTYQPVWGSPPFRNEKMLVTGDGSVWSSLEDMVFWDAGIKRRQLLKPATWKLALTPSRTEDGKVNDYGLGWSLELDDNNQVTAFSHDGSWGGFRTSYYHSPGDNLSIVVLSNRSLTDTDELVDPIYKLITGD